MNWNLTDAQQRASAFLQKPIVAVLEDRDLLARPEAAQYLGICQKWLSDLSGNGPRGGQIEKVVIQRTPYWDRAELDRYARRVAGSRRHGGNGR